MKTKRCAGLVVVILASAGLGFPLRAVARDTLSLSDKSVYYGTFRGFKTDRFYFESEEGKKLTRRRDDVSSLALDPPSKVIIKLRGRKKDEGFVLRGYSEGKFVVLEQGKAQSLSPGNVTLIEMGFDTGRTVEDTAATVISTGEEVDINPRLSTGAVTVVHFHSEGVTSSVRQGRYLETLAKDAKGKVALLRIELSGWDAPAAKQYGITSAPQFWFYNPDGKLVTKLSERFTDADIEKALDKAGK